MTISTTYPTTIPPPAPTAPVNRKSKGQVAPESAKPVIPEQNLHETSKESAKAAGAPTVVQTRSSIEFDPDLNRLVGEIVNRETGEEIIAIPPKEIRALYARIREQLGPLVDEKA